MKELTPANPTPEAFSGLKLELSSSPGFVRGKNWTIDRLLPGDRIVFSDRRIDLDAPYLSGLNEAERGELRLRLRRRDEILHERFVPVRLLARDEWGGAGDMAQLLPAFVMPNDPATTRIMRMAADRLVEHRHSGAMDGYQSGDPARSYMLAAALYSAVAACGLHYAEPPASFETRGQKVRRPASVLADGLATCLDTSLLLAAGRSLARRRRAAPVGDGLTRRSTEGTTP